VAACGGRTPLLAGAQPDAPAGSSFDASVVPPPDLVWYRLDESSGTTAHDSSPNHYDMTNLEGVVWNDGAVFDGATVCGSTSVSQAFRAAPVTMTAWLTAVERADETSTNHALAPFPPNALSGDAPSLGGFGLGLDVWTDGLGGSGFPLETGENAAIAFHTLGAPNAGIEYFVVLVVESTHATVYVDGTLLAQVSADTPLLAQPAPLHLGCHNDDTGYLTKRFFKGRMRDVRVYGRALDGAELAALYTSGPVTAGP
jgi:hypothetical protein